MPIVVTNLFQTAYNLADTFWLGQYSTDALAAISFAFPMVFLLISLGMGISVGERARRAVHRRGRGPGGGVRRLADGDVRGDRLGGPRRRRLLLRRRVPRVDGRVGGRVAPLAASYMEVISLGLVAMFGFAVVFIALMRGYGDTITPMLVMFGSVVLNIALDPFLIFGWGPFPALGIEGAAIATVFSRALALVVGLAIMFRGVRGVRINVADMVPDARATCAGSSRIGLPASIEGTGRAVSMNLLLFIVALFPPGRRRLRDRYAGVLRDFPPGDRGRPRRRDDDDDRPEHRVGQARPGRTGREPGGQETLFAVLSVAGVAVFLVPEPIVSVFVVADQDQPPTPAGWSRSARSSSGSSR